MSCQWQFQQSHSRWEGNIADKLALGRYDQQAFPRPLLSQNTFRQAVEFQSPAVVPEQQCLHWKQVLSTHTHTHTHVGKECHLYCGDPPNVPCSALPLVFYATLEEPINLHNSAHRCHDSEAGRGRRSHHRLGHMTLIPIHLHPSINYTYDKTQARGHP